MGRLTRKGTHNGLAGFWVKEINGTESFISWQDDGYDAIAKLNYIEDLEEQGRLTEQKYGAWKPVLYDSVCSSCGYSETTPLMIMRRDFRYCPNCGAKMVSEAKLKELEGDKE